MNILKSYSRVETQAIATQLAVLEIVTYHNAIGTGLKQTKEQAARVANWVWRKFANSDLVEVTPATKLADQVIQQSQKYVQLPKDELIEKVLVALGTRLECSSSDLERLSATLVREAAAGLDIDENLLLGQQAEEVTRKYWNSCLEDIKKQLKKQSKEQAESMNRMIAARLASMTPAERLELQKTLNLANLSGEAVRGAFLQVGGPLAGVAAVNMIGFGAYIALSVIIHAIFTTMLGITLPFGFYMGASSLISVLAGPLGVALAIAAGLVGYAWGHKKLNRSQYAMIVWACVTHCDRPLYASNELLPSMRPSYFLTEGETGNHSLGEAAVKSDHELAARASEMQLANDTLHSQRKEQERLKKKLSKAEAELAAMKLRTADVATEISRVTREAESWSDKVRAAETKAQVLEAQLRAAEQKYESRVQSRRQEIERLWAVHFPRFIFCSRPLRWVAERTFNERLEVERALVELRDAEDPVSLSRGKMNGTDQHHSAFNLGQKLPARIFFRVKPGQLEITQILKKNEFHTFSANA